MKTVLVDSSVWIDYFRRKESESGVVLDSLIDYGLISVNDLILAELIPFLRLKRKRQIIELLMSVERLPFRIDWAEIMDLQTANLRHGVNNVGIPDLVILQNSIQNSASLFSLDKHFALMRKHSKFDLFMP